MPISLPNFLGANTQKTGMDELLSNAIEGYRAAREPKKIRQEEQYRELANILLGHQGVNEGIKSQYLPQEYEANIGHTNALTGLTGAQTETANINNQTLGARNQADLSSKLLGNREQELKNAIMEATGMNSAEADIALKKAQARVAPFMHLTAEQKNALAAGYDPESEEYKKLMQNQLGIFDAPLDANGKPIPIPKHAISLAGKFAGERGHYETEMRKNIERGEQARISNETIDQIIKITKDNPRLNRSFSYILEDPDLSNPSTLKKALSGLRENEKAQIETLVKLTNDLILSQDAVQPGRGSDERRKMIAASKVGVGMTDQAKFKIADNMKKKNAPLISYADEAAPFVGSYYIPYQAKNYQNKEPSVEAAINAQQPQEGGSTALVHIETDDGSYDIPISKVDAFMLSRKDRNPKIIMGGQ